MKMIKHKNHGIHLVETIKKIKPLRSEDQDNMSIETFQPDEGISEDISKKIQAIKPLTYQRKN